MLADRHGLQLRIEFISAPHGERFLPVAAVRVERVSEVMMLAVGVRIGPGRGTQQRKPQHVALRVVAIFRIVDQAEAMRSVAEIGPAQRRHFEFRRFPGVIARGRPLDGTVRNFVGRLPARRCERERRFEQHMGLVPIDTVDDIHAIQARIERDVLHEFRMLPAARDANHRAQRSVFHHLHGIGGIETGKSFFKISVDVPGVVLFGIISEGDQLVATSPGRNRFKVGSLVEQARNAARFGIHHDPQRGILEGQIVRDQIRCRTATAGRHAQKGIAERRNCPRLGEQMHGVGSGVRG